MRVCIVHNSYVQRAGEERVVEEESRALQEHGVIVDFFLRDSAEIADMNPYQKLGSGISSIWSLRTYRGLRKHIQMTRPDVVHVHNLMPLLTYSAIDAAYDEGVPVVWTLHNYRLTCLNGLHFRSGALCMLCTSHNSGWSGVINRCFRGSLTQSVAALGARNFNVRFRRILDRVSRIICLSDFQKNHMNQSFGVGDKIVVKANMSSAMPIDTRKTVAKPPYIIYAGRLSAEKGIEVLIAAWKAHQLPTLKVFGSGEMTQLVVSASTQNVEYHGQVDKEQLMSMLDGATALIVPSFCFEGYPMAIVEAFSRGVPVIASDYGSLPQIVKHEKNGLLFRVNDANALAKTVNDLVFGGDARVERLSIGALKTYADDIWSGQNVMRLLNIYEDASRARKGLEAEN